MFDRPQLDVPSDSLIQLCTGYSGFAPHAVRVRRQQQRSYKLLIFPIFGPHFVQFDPASPHH